MAINLNNFVNVNIKYHESSDIKSTREVATLILFGKDEYTEVDEVNLNGNYYIKNDQDEVEQINKVALDYTGEIYSNAEGTTLATALTLDDGYYTTNQDEYVALTSITLTSGQLPAVEAYIKNDYSQPKEYKKLDEVDSNDTLLFNYAKYFFNNGGVVLKVVESEKAATKENYLEILKTLHYTEIVVMSNAPFDVSLEVAKENTYIKEETTIGEETMSAIDQKIIISEIGNITEYIQNYESEAKDVQFFVAKYSNLTAQCGIAATVAAYLTQINVDEIDSIKDYAFTQEEIYDERKPIVDDDSEIKNVIKYNLNADALLLSEVRNIGGNDTAGRDLVNQFMLICLHQTLTEKLVELLTTKVKYNNTGLTLISSVINDELQRYVNNGYLATNKSWTDNDLVYNGYTVIKKNTPLSLGYKYIILPFSTLTQKEKKDHKLPNIYVLISDNYSIRKIEIVGEVY